MNFSSSFVMYFVSKDISAKTRCGGSYLVFTPLISKSTIAKRTMKTRGFHFEPLLFYHVISMNLPMIILNYLLLRHNCASFDSTTIAQAQHPAPNTQCPTTSYLLRETVKYPKSCHSYQKLFSPSKSHYDNFCCDTYLSPSISYQFPIFRIHNGSPKNQV